MTISVSAPGSLMLLGEHAVLYGETAIVCAISGRIRVSLTPVLSKVITLRSKLGELQFFVDDIHIQAPFTFVLTAISYIQAQLKTGFILEIDSDFSEQMGFASSAAVTVATLAALHLFLYKEKITPLDLFRQAHAVILKVQNRGSGADLAACIYGGTLAYQMNPLKITKLIHNPLITAIYSGSKMPTAIVIALVSAAYDKEPEKFEKLFKEIGQCSEKAMHALNTGDFASLAEAMNKNQQLMTEMGVNNTALQLIIDTLMTDKGVLAAKISGSGLGDCVVGLLNANHYNYPLSAEQKQLNIQHIPISVSPEGIIYE